MSADAVTDSARKRNRKDVLANNDKTRINIGHQQHDGVEGNIESSTSWLLWLSEARSTTSPHRPQSVIDNEI